MKDGKSIATVRKKRQAASKPPVRDVFTVICKTDLKVECVKEFKFHPVRKSTIKLIKTAISGEFTPKKAPFLP